VPNGRPLSRIGEDGRKWLGRPKLCIKKKKKEKKFVSNVTNSFHE